MTQVLIVMIHFRDCVYILFFHREHVFQSSLKKVMQASWADSTVKKYNNAVAIFKFGAGLINWILCL